MKDTELSNEGETTAYSSIPAKDLEEIFPRPAVKEVAFEIRFSPRLRIREQLWQFQDLIANDYPDASEDQMLIHPERLTPAHVFSNPAELRSIKISQENFVVSVLRYTTYEEFKELALSRAGEFCKTFSIERFVRVGLRYINHIEVGAQQPLIMLQRYVNAPLRFDRFEASTVTQLLSEFRLRFQKHQMTLRGALLQVPDPGGSYAQPSPYIYVLDLDCYAENETLSSLSSLLDVFHEAIQIEFLRHVTEEYKRTMRSEK